MSETPFRIAIEGMLLPDGRDGTRVAWIIAKSDKKPGQGSYTMKRSSSFRAWALLTGVGLGGMAQFGADIEAQVIVPRSESYPSTGASFGGTGTGNEASFGTGTTGTGVETGAGLGSTGTGQESDSAGLSEGTPAFMRPMPGMVIGEGMPEDLRSPDNPALIPFDFISPRRGSGPPRPGEPAAPALTAEDLTKVYKQLFDNAMRLTDPEVRIRALDRLARSEIFGNKLNEAVEAIKAAGETAATLPDGTIKNIRLVSLVTTSTNLSDGLVRESVEEGTEDRYAWVDKAKGVWQRAADLSGMITNADLRSEMMSRVALDISEDAQTIAAKVSEYEQVKDIDKERKDRYVQALDELFDLAIDINNRVPMKVWRNEVAEKIATKGALALRFDRALKAARTIRQNAPRALALARVGEALARYDRSAEATEVFVEASQSAAAVKEDSVRHVVAGDLVDRLIALGRFRDARMASYLYGDDESRMKALGAIAENQARRGDPNRAVAWINAEIAPEHRSVLIKRVQDGAVQAIQSNLATGGDLIR